MTAGSPIPRAAVLVARAYLVLAGLAAIAGGLAGLAMQAELWSPEISASAALYDRMLRTHGALLEAAIAAPALAGMLGYIVVADAARAPALRAPWLTVLGAIAWVAALGASVVVVVVQPAAHMFEAPSIAAPLAATLFAGAGLLAALHLGWILAAGVRGAAPLALGIAAVFVAGVAGACATALVDAIAAWGAAAWYVRAHDDLAAGCTWIAAAALATAALLRGAERSPNPIVMLVGLAGAIGWAFALPRAGCLATIAAWGACIARGGWRRPAASVVGLALVPALLVLAFARPLMLSEDLQLHLHDTYFVVGHWHLWAAVVAFAALAALLAWAPALLGREPQAGLARLGAACCGVGTLIHAIAELVLGARGMPRRYVSYIPDFILGHRVATLGAALAAAGLAIIAVACLRGQRSNTAYSGS